MGANLTPGYFAIFYFLQTSRNIIGLKWTRGNRVYSIQGQYIFNTRLVVELSPLFLSKTKMILNNETLKGSPRQQTLHSVLVT